MDYKDHEKTAKEYNIGKGGFWRFETGDNRFRLLGGYEPYGSHWIQADGRSYICIGKDKGCKHCEKGNKPTAKFLMWVFDRKTKEVRLAQTGYQVIKQIGVLALSDDWAFDGTPDYDMVIKKTGEKLDTEYALTPTPDKTQLTEEEQALVNEKVKDLKEIIGKMKEKAGGSADDNSGEPPPEHEEINVEEIPF